jgi:cobalt transporter subunit CbtA
MIGRVLLAAILAGIAAGLIMGVIQHVRLTPLIIEAETFEHVAHGHGAVEHSHGDQAWSPADGPERTFYTTLTAIVAAAGFALLLAGISFIANIPITPSNGWIWGLCGFIAVSFNPSISLPPELPGMPAVDTATRQIWWVACIAISGLGLWILAVAKDNWWRIAGVAGLAVPHVFAPAQPTETGAHIPSQLVAQFVSNSLAANMVMWMAIGLALGYALKKFESVFDK